MNYSDVMSFLSSVPFHIFTFFLGVACMSLIILFWKFFSPKEEGKIKGIIETALRQEEDSLSEDLKTLKEFVKIDFLSKLIHSKKQTLTSFRRALREGSLSKKASAFLKATLTSYEASVKRAQKELERSKAASVLEEAAFAGDCRVLPDLPVLASSWQESLPEVPPISRNKREEELPVTPTEPLPEIPVEEETHFLLKKGEVQSDTDGDLFLPPEVREAIGSQDNIDAIALEQ